MTRKRVFGFWFLVFGFWVLGIIISSKPFCFLRTPRRNRNYILGFPLPTPCHAATCPIHVIILSRGFNSEIALPPKTIEVNSRAPAWVLSRGIGIEMAKTENRKDDHQQRNPLAPRATTGPVLLTHQNTPAALQAQTYEQRDRDRKDPKPK